MVLKKKNVRNAYCLGLSVPNKTNISLSKLLKIYKKKKENKGFYTQ